MQNRVDKKKEHLIKLIIIGDCAVGKTNLLMRFCENTYKTSYVSTIGVDFKIKTINVNGNIIKFQIWDTAGQERYRNIARTYYKGAAGIILVYSVAEENTFQNLQKWIKQINEHAPAEVPRILVGNKIDVDEEERQVTTLQGKTLADKNEFPFLQVSAKTGQNVAKVFETIGRQIVENSFLAHSGKDQRMNLRNHSDGKKKGIVNAEMFIPVNIKLTCFLR